MWSVGAKYRYDFGGDVLLNLQYQHIEAKLDNLSAIRTRESRNDRNEEIASIRLDYVGSDSVQFFLKGYFHDWNTAYVSIRNDVVTGAPIVVYPAGTYWGYRDYGLSALAKLRLHRGLEYLVGYEYQNFRGRDDVLLIGDTRENVHAGIFQLRTTDDLSDRARFSAGLRHNEGSGTSSTVWNVTGRFDLSEALYLEANGGTSFLLPDASQLYQIDPCCELGNPNLKPEESLAINASVGGRVPLSTDARLTWKATYFQRRIDNLISVSYADPAYPDGIYMNSDARVHMRGAEAQLAAQTESGWMLSASYTYTRARDQGSQLQRDRTPEHFANGAISYSPQNQPFGLNASVNWVGDSWRTVSGFGRRNYGNYAVVNLGAQVYPDGPARRHRLGLTLENAFNRDYASSGYASAQKDDGTGRFLYYTRGVPRTLRVSYGVSF